MSAIAVFACYLPLDSVVVALMALFAVGTSL